MRIGICEDNARDAQQLKQLLISFFSERGIANPELSVYPDGESLLLDEHPSDLVFLDIRLPGQDGIRVGQQLKEQNPEAIVLVTTNYPQYLDDALRFQAFRYLTKPLLRQRLFDNLEDALRLYHSHSAYVGLETGGTCMYLRTDEIICVRSQTSGTLLYTTQGDFPSAKRIGDWSRKLPEENFFLTHKGFLVNLLHVISFTRDAVSLTHGKPDAYLTRSRYRQFRDTYLLYLKHTRYTQ